MKWLSIFTYLKRTIRNYSDKMMQTHLAAKCFNQKRKNPKDKNLENWHRTGIFSYQHIFLKGGVMSQKSGKSKKGLVTRSFPIKENCVPDQLRVFSVTPFKIDQNKNQNRPINKVQNLGNKRRYICKDPRQDSGQRNISYTRYPKKCFTQIYRDVYGDSMLVLTWMSSNMADGNQQKHLLPSFATKA